MPPPRPPLPSSDDTIPLENDIDDADAEGDALFDMTVGDEIPASEKESEMYIYDHAGFVGQPVRIDHAVKLMVPCNVKLADRLRRVMGFKKRRRRRTRS